MPISKGKTESNNRIILRLDSGDLLLDESTIVFLLFKKMLTRDFMPQFYKPIAGLLSKQRMSSRAIC
jgi:hypothetical protein